jgi:hypothetical protein
MEYQAPKSRCRLCNSELTRQGLTRHIKSCLTKHLQKPSKTKSRNLLYLNISDAFNPDYFLHLLISGNSTLKDLDVFLRDIWLECCGHLSSFSLQRYGDEIHLKHKVEDIFIPGVKLIYQYDFGSTTELSIKAVYNYHGTTERNKKIQIIARNAQPIIPCDECGLKPAVRICTECQWDENGRLCEECSQTHECGDEMFLPVVNSPRAGVCGYTGD